MAIDPVCKMMVDKNNPKFTSEHEGKIYYFCAAGCKRGFEENPEKFVKLE